ncbi:unnamed protein product [Mytilus coruscus]|uniref:Tyr recombinase domain-containing protein n=1 Tax=Mytilus coruscus TaxID=42192 RepID=A0A6J8EQD9_MYTCO|nr:unnamed protein product [Mytilus coruscus]
MSKQVLKQLYIENSSEGVTPIETQQTENFGGNEMNTNSSPESIVPITLAELVHQHRSSVSNDENENGGTDRKKIESQNIAQCFAGLQETFKQLINRDKTQDMNREFNLQQWYNHAVICNRSETYTSNRRNYQEHSLQGNTKNASFISGTHIGNFSFGVHSDEYSNVDIISPSIQKQIIDDKDKEISDIIEMNNFNNKNNNLVVLKLKQSKTDPLRKGIDIQLHKLGRLICPYKILLEYIQVRKEFSPINQTDPLFITIDKKPLERQYFLTCIKKVLGICGFNSSHYNSHSFRIGPATSAGKAQIEDHLIKTLGRWSSDSYIRYIRVTPASIKTDQSRLTSFNIQHNQQSNDSIISVKVVERHKILTKLKTTSSEMTQIMAKSRY